MIVLEVLGVVVLFGLLAATWAFLGICMAWLICEAFPRLKPYRAWLLLAGLFLFWLMPFAATKILIDDAKEEREERERRERLKRPGSW